MPTSLGLNKSDCELRGFEVTGGNLLALGGGHLESPGSIGNVGAFEVQP